MVYVLASGSSKPTAVTINGTSHPLSASIQHVDTKLEGRKTSAGDVAKQSAASVLTSHIPFGGFGKKKQQADQPAPDKNASQKGDAQQPTRAILMETQITVSNFSSDPVDEGRLAVPAGFKQVEAKETH